MTYREIAKFCAKHGIAESTFGRKAMNDPAFMTRMRAGAEMRPSTIARVCAYMDKVTAIAIERAKP